MANSQHIPGLIRGHEGTIIMVDHGQFESVTDHITLRPEVSRRRVSRDVEPEVKPMFDDYKFGAEEVTIPVEKNETLFDAHPKFPELHAYAQETASSGGNRSLRASADHDGGGILPHRARFYISTKRSGSWQISR